MRVAKRTKSSLEHRWVTSAVPLGTDGRAATTLSTPTLVATVWSALDIRRRAGILGTLLGSVGPLALAVVGGGAFARYLQNARYPIVPVSFEDAALATSSQVYELVRYVEQSNPALLDGMLNALMQDGTTLTALGASAAAVTIKHLNDRRKSAIQTPSIDRD